MSSLPKKLTYHLVQFAYGTGAATFARFTNKTADVSYLSNTYTSVPKLALELPANTGAVEERALVVELPVSAHALFASLVSGEPFSPVYVTALHVNEPLADDGGSNETMTVCAAWRLAKATKNPSKKRGIVRLEAVGPKNELRVPLGIPANYHCVWTLFGNGCDLAPVSDTGTLTAIDATDPKKVTITGISVSVPGPTPGKTFHRGYVEKDGIRVDIRDWSSSASSTFFLVRRPPAAWVGATVTVFAGCDKTIETCRNRWANEARFGGFGYAMPNYHPVFEVP